MSKTTFESSDELITYLNDQRVVQLLIVYCNKDQVTSLTAQAKAMGAAYLRITQSPSGKITILENVPDLTGKTIPNTFEGGLSKLLVVCTDLPKEKVAAGPRVAGHTHMQICAVTKNGVIVSHDLMMSFTSVMQCFDFMAKPHELPTVKDAYLNNLHLAGDYYIVYRTPDYDGGVVSELKRLVSALPYVDIVNLRDHPKLNTVDAYVSLLVACPSRFVTILVADSVGELTPTLAVINNNARLVMSVLAVESGTAYTPPSVVCSNADTMSLHDGMRYLTDQIIQRGRETDVVVWWTHTHPHFKNTTDIPEYIKNLRDDHLKHYGQYHGGGSPTSKPLLIAPELKQIWSGTVLPEIRHPSRVISAMMRDMIPVLVYRRDVQFLQTADWPFLVTTLDLVEI